MTGDAALREAAADALRRLVRSAGLMAFCGPFGAPPFRGPEELQRLLAAASPAESVLARLLFGGECVARAAADEDAIALLLRAGVLRAEAGGVRSPRLLVGCFNRHVLAAPPPGHPGFDPMAAPYCGPESLWFAQFLALRGPYEAALDLCTGGGLLAMLPQARRMTAVDSDAEALGIAAFNLALNRRSHVVLRHGDLFAPVHGEAFDLICANPPFLPGGPGPRLPASGDGGPRGDAVLARILCAAPAHLAPGGEALIYAEGFGGRDGPAILADLPRMPFPPTHDCTCWIGGTRDAGPAIFDLCRLWQAVGASEAAAWAHWRVVAEAMPVSHYHHVVWRISDGSGAVAARRMRPG